MSVLEELGRRAAEMVPDGAVIGLGAGRAAEAFVRALAARAAAGLSVRGVPTSSGTAALARSLGLTVVDLPDHPLALTVDGADEVDPRLDLVKGYGGALVRERIVGAASARRVILVGEEKLVPVLGSRGRLPLEANPFALPLVLRRIEAMGLSATPREGRSDNGGLLLDVAVGPIEDPHAMEEALRAIPGVVDTGLFLGFADLVLVGAPGGIREMTRA